MNVLEHEIEEIIEQYSLTKDGCDKISERGLPVNSSLLRQVRIGGYGIIDLMSVRATFKSENILIELSVYELKKDKVDIGSVLQLCRYMSGIEHLLNDHKSYLESKHGMKMCLYPTYGYLIGKKIDTRDDIVYLYDHLDEDISIYEYSIDLDKGILFKEVNRGWTLTEPEFKDDLLGDLIGNI